MDAIDVEVLTLVAIEFECGWAYHELQDAADLGTYDCPYPDCDEERQMHFAETYPRKIRVVIS